MLWVVLLAPLINKHGFSCIFPPVPVSKERVPEDRDVYRAHTYDLMNGDTFTVGSQVRELDVFAALRVGNEVAVMGGEVRTVMWVLLLSLLALSLVPGHITQGFDPRKNCLANKGPELFPKSAGLRSLRALLAIEGQE